MRIGIVSSAVPLVQGGGRFISDWLASKLTEAGHRVETIWIPSSDEPDRILSQMAAFRMVRLEKSCDRIIAIRPPAHALEHPVKIVWFIHHARAFYDLWDSPHRAVPDTPYWRAFRQSLIEADTRCLLEAKSLFSISREVQGRLKRFNGIDSEVLYTPVFEPERFRNDGFGDEIVCICRMEAHKRQHLLVQAMRHTKTPVRLRLAGASMDPSYVAALKDDVRRFALEDRVVVDDRWISEEEKVALMATALASAYVPFEEDGFGYPTVEAAHAGKATIGLADGGGVLDFVVDGHNGFLAEPDPEAIADVFDRLYGDRALARELGEAAGRRILELDVTWTHVLERLLA